MCILESATRHAADIPCLEVETAESLTNPSNYLQPGQSQLLSESTTVQVSTTNKMAKGKTFFISDVVIGVTRECLPGKETNPAEFAISLGQTAYLIPGRGVRKCFLFQVGYFLLLLI